MTVRELAAALKMSIVHPGADDGNREVTSGYTSDLLSDVMAHAPDGSALITIQAHVNTVAVAALTGIAAIIICNNLTVPIDMLEAAQKENVAIIHTEHNQFTTSYMVHCLICC